MPSCGATRRRGRRLLLTTRGRLQAGETVLVQGAGGGVSTALVPLAKAMGLRVWVTGRDAGKREHAVALGADAAFEAALALAPGNAQVAVNAATWWRR